MRGPVVVVPTLSELAARTLPPSSEHDGLSIVGDITGVTALGRIVPGWWARGLAEGDSAPTRALLRYWDTNTEAKPLGSVAHVLGMQAPELIDLLVRLVILGIARASVYPVRTSTNRFYRHAVLCGCLRVHVWLDGQQL